MGKPKEEEKWDDSQDEELKRILGETGKIKEASKGVFEKINHFKDISSRIQEKQTEIAKENDEIADNLKSNNQEIVLKSGDMIS